MQTYTCVYRYAQQVCRLAEREVSVLRSIRHPSLVELQAAFRSPRGRIYLVFPYYGVSAYQLLRAYQKEQLQQQGIERQLIGLGGGHGGGGGGLPAVELKLLAWQMLQALSYLHTNQVRRGTIITQDYRLQVCHSCRQPWLLQALAYLHAR